MNHQSTQRPRVKIGDQVKLAYISDGNPQNNIVGIVTQESVYDYYPNGTPDKSVQRQWCTIQYPDGTTTQVDDTQRPGSGIVSPLTILT